MLTIARYTLWEIRRRRLAWVMAGMGTVFLSLFAMGVWFISRELRSSGADIVTRGPVLAMLTTAAMYVIQFLVLVLAAVIAVDTLAGEISSGTIQTVVTKPIRRWEIVVGKFVGHALVVALFALSVAGGALAIVRLTAGYAPPAFWLPVGLIVGEGLIMLALTYMGGAVTGTLANGLIVFMLYAVALAGSWIERIGSLIGNQSAQYLGIMASLIMPTEAVWHRAATSLLPSIIGSTIGMFSPFTATNPPSDAMMVYAAAYGLVALGVAIAVFERRDL